MRPPALATECEVLWKELGRKHRQRENGRGEGHRMEEIWKKRSSLPTRAVSYTHLTLPTILLV
eukprot:5933978-Pleurochrysis_carterae.AAC.1